LYVNVLIPQFVFGRAWVSSHPYNPLKSLTHPFEGAPTGRVTLTRSTVLVLSGWSNTQFSYWARRAEAISVLAKYDQRLRSVGDALERRLHALNKPASSHSSSASAAPASSDEGITGKGLDVIIEDVKRRTGASQFLRGKHSSLDPYGSPAHAIEPFADLPVPAPVFNATFQAESYTHSPPPPSAPPPRGRTRRPSEKGRKPVVESASEGSLVASFLSEPSSPQTNITSPTGDITFLSPLSQPSHPDEIIWGAASRIEAAYSDGNLKNLHEGADDQRVTLHFDARRNLPSFNEEVSLEGVVPKRKRSNENEGDGRKRKAARRG
jgi:hypothetical protein